VDVTLEFIATCIYSDVDPRHHRSTRRVSFLAAQNPSTNIRKFHVYDANAHIFSRSCRQIYLAKYLENSAPTGSGWNYISESRRRRVEWRRRSISCSSLKKISWQSEFDRFSDGWTRRIDESVNDSLNGGAVNFSLLLRNLSYWSHRPQLFTRARSALNGSHGFDLPHSDTRAIERLANWYSETETRYNGIEFPLLRPTIPGTSSFPIYFDRVCNRMKVLRSIRLDKDL